MSTVITFTDPADNKEKVGGVILEDTFIKRVKDSKKHFMRKHQAYGIERVVIDALRGSTVKTIIIEVADKREIWEIPLYKFLQEMVVDQFPPFDQQCFVSIQFWKPRII